MDEKKVMSEEQKKEVRDLFDGEMGTQIDGLESYLRDLYKIADECDNNALKSCCRIGLRNLNNMRFDFQMNIDLGVF